MGGSSDNKDVELNEKFGRHLLITSLSSFFAGTIGKLTCHPIDTIKAKFQVQVENFHFENYLRRPLINIAQKTYQEEGIRGFYKGIGIATLGAMPAFTIYLGSYEIAKKLLLRNKFLSEMQSLSFFLSGMIAETVSCILWVPIDVIKERMQVQSNLKTYHYRHAVHAIRTIAKGEGLRGLYKAYGATVGSFGPYSALYFMFYEKLKEMFVKKDEQIGSLKSFSCSGVAGAMASLLTNPLDMAKLRMQVDRAQRGAVIASGGQATFVQQRYGYNHMLAGVWSIYQKEGFWALYKGSWARVLFFTPQNAIAFCVVETARGYLNKVIPE